MNKGLKIAVFGVIFVFLTAIWAFSGDWDAWDEYERSEKTLPDLIKFLETDEERSGDQPPPPGSPANPYIITDGKGRLKAYGYTLFGDDDSAPPGSIVNPFIITDQHGRMKGSVYSLFGEGKAE